MNFYIFLGLKFWLLSKSKALEMMKSVFSELLDAPKLISRKFWVIGKSWNFHTVWQQNEIQTSQKNNFLYQHTFFNIVWKRKYFFGSWALWSVPILSPSSLPLLHKSAIITKALAPIVVLGIFLMIGWRKRREALLWKCLSVFFSYFSSSQSELEKGQAKKESG